MRLNTRLTKIVREILTRKTRTALVVSSIFIGVFGVVTLFSMGDIIVGALEGAVDIDRLAMIRTYVTLKSSTATPDPAFLDTLRALPGATAAQAMTIYPAYWRLPGEDRFREARIFGYSEPLDAVPLEPVELVAGRWPQPGQHEIVIERRFASTNGLSVGATLELRDLSGSQDGVTPRAESWTVVGTVFEPYSYPILPGASALIPTRTMLFAAGDDAQTIAGLSGFNAVLIRFDDFATAQAQTRAFETALTDSSPYVPVTTLVEDPAQNSLIEQTHIMRSVLSLLAMVALVVSGFLVLNVINAAVFEQRRQIGVMKALGAGEADHTVMYGGLALAYGVIGVVPGVLLGVPAGYSAAQNLAPQFNIFLDKFTIAWQAVAIGAVLGVIVPVLSAVVPVLRALRVTILEAITDRGINATYGAGPLVRLIDVVPLPIGFRQSLRNVSLKRGRLALTIVTLALAAGAFMGVYAALASFNTILNSVFQQIGSDISVGLRGASDYETVRGLILDHVDGLKAIGPSTALAIDIDGYTKQDIGPGPSFLLGVGFDPTSNVVHFQLRSGAGWSRDPTLHGVVIAAPIADGLGVGPGDTITIHVGSRAQMFPVLGVSRYSFQTVWMRWEDLSELGGLTRGGPVPNRYLTTLDLNGTSTTAIGLDSTVAPFLTFTSGAFFSADAPGAILTMALAERRGLAVGDTLALTVGGQALDVPVTGVFTIPPQLQQPGTPDEVIGLDWQRLAALEGLPLDGEPFPGGLDIVMTHHRASAAAVSDKIAEINDVLLANGINATYTNWSDSAESLTQMIQTAGIVLNTASALIAAVGAIGLLTALSMSVFERQKEIGVMRSVGATSYAVALQFLIEGLIVGVIAWVLGVPFSYALDHTLIEQFGFANVAGAEYPTITLLLGLVSMLIIATLASLWPSIGAARKTVSDILRYQ